MGTSYQTVIDALEARHCRFDRRTDTQAVCQCPAHEDNNPSLSITYKRDGDKAKTLLNCFAGCTVDSIVAALGLKESDLFDHDRNDETIPQHTAMPRENSTHAPQWRRCDSYVFAGMIDNTPLTGTEYNRLCEQTQAAHGARANIAMGACPNCKNRTLRLVCVAVPPSQYFTLAHCEHCSARDLFEAFTTFDASMKRRMSVSDTHVVIYENDNGVRFAYPDGVTVCRKADGKGGKRIRRQGDKGKHVPYLSDVVLDYLPARDKTIYVVEGEKDATALLAAGYAAVSLLGGAANVTACNDPAALLDTVRGCNVVCVVDDDRQGLAWADAVHGMLASHIGKDIISLRFIQGRDGIHDAGDAAATGRFDAFNVLKRSDLTQPEPEPQQEQGDAPACVRNGRRIALTAASDVKVERPVFLHSPLVPTKVLTLIAGRAGVSKSTLSIDIAAKATNGTLEGDWQGRPVNVAFAAIEDDAGMQKARLQAAGANMRRVLFMTVDDTRNGSTISTGLRLPDDAAILSDTLREHDVKLLVIDPITSAIDGNTNDRDDVRDSLDPLAAIAQKLEIAIIGIAHFNKGGGYASDKVSGSHAFRDVVRSMLLVAKDDETGECVVTLDKSSYTQQDGTSYRYELQSRFITDDDGKRMGVPIIAGFTSSNRNVHDVINRNVAGGDTTARANDHEVEEWLTSYLAENGPTTFKQIADDAKDAEGYTSEQLRNARKRARDPQIVTMKDPDYTGRGQRRLWQLET